jgi:hypothetical protein
MLFGEVFLMGEIGTDENFGDKTGGDRQREHCTVIRLKKNVKDEQHRPHRITCDL